MGLISKSGAGRCGGFGGIRSDLRHMMKNIQQLEVDVTNTNKRVDDLYKK